MIKIAKNATEIFLTYTPLGDADWIDNRIKSDGEVILKGGFTFTGNELTNSPINSGQSTRVFRVAALVGDYFVVPAEVLDIKFELKIHKDIAVSRATFIGEANVSIFKKLDALVQSPMIIGGSEPGAIPDKDFENIISNFPTKTEISHYANSRISNILVQYIDSTTDSSAKLAKLLNKHKTITAPSFVKDFYLYEIEKFMFLRDKLIDMLTKVEAFNEHEWQLQILEIILLLYPKYISQISNMQIPDEYTDPLKITDRYIDLTLIDSNGNLDIIEIKKPFDDCILSSLPYRDNFTPKKELSGAIMQTEKYVFYLNKWGSKGEKSLNSKYASILPAGIEIKISNPKSIVILGRSFGFSNRQARDFEIIKRKYSNIIDIMSYDDMLKRLENTINKFTGKK